MAGVYGLNIVETVVVISVIRLISHSKRDRWKIYLYFSSRDFIWGLIRNQS